MGKSWLRRGDWEYTDNAVEQTYVNGKNKTIGNQFQLAFA